MAKSFTLNFSKYPFEVLFNSVRPIKSYRGAIWISKKVLAYAQTQSPDTYDVIFRMTGAQIDSAMEKAWNAILVDYSPFNIHWFGTMHKADFDWWSYQVSHDPECFDWEIKRADGLEEESFEIHKAYRGPRVLPKSRIYFGAGMGVRDLPLINLYSELTMSVLVDEPKGKLSSEEYQIEEYKVPPSVPAPIPGKDTIVYARGFPYGAPLVMLRGAGTYSLKSWLREGHWTYNSSSYAWEHYLGKDEFRQVLQALAGAGYKIRPKDNMNPGYIIKEFPGKTKVPNGNPLPVEGSYDPYIVLSSKDIYAMTMDQIELGLNNLVKGKAGKCNISRLRIDPKIRRWTYRVTCGETYSSSAGWIVKIKAFSKDKRITDIKKMDVALSCNCPAFMYQGPEYYALREDYLDGKPAGYATVPNFARYPHKKGFKTCKHVEAIFRSLKAAPPLPSERKLHEKYPVKEPVPKKPLPTAPPPVAQPPSESVSTPTEEPSQPSAPSMPSAPIPSGPPPGAMPPSESTSESTSIPTEEGESGTAPAQGLKPGLQPGLKPGLK